MAEKNQAKANLAKILFGEYFFEGGGQFIAFPAEEFVQVSIEKKKGLLDIEFDDQVQKKKFSKKQEPENKICKAFDMMFASEIDLPKQELKITITGPAQLGTQGYYSALNVALVRAMSQLSIEKWKDEKIIQMAEEAEKITGDDASGVNKHCAAYSSFIISTETGKAKYHPAKVGKPLFLVAARAAGKQDRGKEIELAKEKAKASEVEFKSAVLEAKKIVSRAKKELSYGGMKELGGLMLENQKLLSQNGFSFPEAEQIIKVVAYEGALGAKISGYEGEVLILCENEKQQDRIVQTLTGRGFIATKAKAR